jgi:hypothetical protein
MIEFACPESCQYLRSGREQAAERERELHRKETAEGRFMPELSRRLLPVMYEIDGAIIGAQRDRNVALSDLVDTEVLDAVETTIKNLETEESGLIYEHRAASPRVEEVSRRIRAALDEASRKMTGEDRLLRGEMIKVLNLLRITIQSHIRRDQSETGSPQSYVRYISLFIPWPEEAAKPLII